MTWKMFRRLRARTADTTSELQRAGNPWGVALRSVTQTRRQRVPTRGPAATVQDRQSHPPVRSSIFLSKLEMFVL